MVLVFDLDDTLYDERSYVESGIRAVADFGAAALGLDPDDSHAFMVATLDREGRGAIFDRWLEAHGLNSRARVSECLQVYRRHRPAIRLSDEAEALLPRLSSFPLYLVTDGHKGVQAAKVEALGVAPFFRGIFITHRYGVRNAKPSTHCFDLIRRREGIEWSEMTHIADNPAKDFVGLNPLGVRTVRVLTGGHRTVEAAPGHDARYTIPDLGHLLALLEGTEEGAPRRQTRARPSARGS